MALCCIDECQGRITRIVILQRLFQISKIHHDGIAEVCLPSRITWMPVDGCMGAILQIFAFLVFFEISKKMHFLLQLLVPPGSKKYFEVGAETSGIESSR